MLEFKQPLTVPIPDDKYELVYEWVYEWDIKGFPTQRIIIPKGYINDGASVPRIAWSITGIRPDGLNRAAALVHDWIYDHRGRLPFGSHVYYENGHWIPSAHQWTRKEADKMFGRLMREAGVTPYRRKAAYWAVRLFGWSGW